MGFALGDVGWVEIKGALPEKAIEAASVEPLDFREPEVRLEDLRRRWSRRWMGWLAIGSICWR